MASRARRSSSFTIPPRPSRAAGGARSLASRAARRLFGTAEAAEELKAGAPDPGEALRHEIIARVERLTAGAGAPGPPGPQADAGAVGDIERLDRLLRAYEHARPTKAPRRWPVLLALAVTAVMVSALVFIRVGSTEARFELELSSVYFQLAGGGGDATGPPIELTTGELGARRVIIDGYVEVEPGSAGIEIPASPWLALSSADEPIALDPIALPPGTWVRLSRDDLDGGLALILEHEGRPLTISLTVPPGASVATAGRPPSRATEPDGEAYPVLAVRSEPGRPLQVRVTPPEGASLGEPFNREIPVEALGFERVEESLPTGDKILSTVLGGALYLERLAGKKYELGRGEHLDVGLGSGRVTALSLAPNDRIALRATGDVRELSVGGRNDDGAHNLMPRWMEWLQARHEFGLFWGTVGYLFAVLLAVMRWWGIAR